MSDRAHTWPRGVVVAPQRVAAEAGAAALAGGGSAADAAVACAFALCVVDPGNCGIGGYGGFLTYAEPGEAPVQVDFDTWVPARIEESSFPSRPGARDEFADGGRSVAPPMVVPGLLAAHERFGRLPLADLLAPAVAFARDGCVVTRDVARALESHWERTKGGAGELARIFFPDGRLLRAGERLVQADLAGTLEAIAAGGGDALRSGPLVEAICDAVAADGGFLAPSDFETGAVAAGPAPACAFAGAMVYGPPPEKSGAGVLFGALAGIEPARLGELRGRSYVAEVGRALAAAWRARTGAALAAASLRHTATLAAADAGGALAALTFTHGSLWFGSGIVVPGTGIVLNAGANLFAAAEGGPLAATNMSPIVIEEAGGARHALGATGGPRIPAILTTAVADVVHYGVPLAQAIAAPHLSVRAADGSLESEPELFPLTGTTQEIAPGDFGPAAGVTVRDGRAVPAVDPRFDAAAA